MRRTDVEPLLIGLDVNSTRVRAVSGTSNALARALALDGTEGELPLAVSLEGRRPEVGRAGLALCRLAPHVVCQDYLAALGGPREWQVGRHRLDAARLFTLVWQKIQSVCEGAKGLTLSLPSYVTAAQAAQLTQLAAKAKLPVFGSLTTPLAVTLAAHNQQAFTGLALVVDVDDHALSLAGVAVDDEQARLLGSHALPGLKSLAWTNAFINAIADRCVRHSRRDPRESAPAEQSLYEQLDDALDACRQGRTAELGIRAAQWFQNLLLQPEEIMAFSGRLVRQTVQAALQFLNEVAFQSPRAVLVTDAASRLPGLVAALGGLVEEPAEPPALQDGDDFGEDLFPAEQAQAGVIVLTADAPSRVAHEVAERMLRGALPREHLAASLPLAEAPSVDSGPARLQFRDQNYPLHGSQFTLGRQPNCDLVFDSAFYPMVSGRHCEIGFERRCFFVRDRSRNGTWLNDRPVTQQTPLNPGDWIRLGPDGPLLRFLGRASDARQLGTTA